MRTNIGTLCTLAVAGVLAGCTSSALERSTLGQGATVSDIVAEMVLDNLEMTRQSPNALPWHLKITQGSISVADTLTPSYSYVWPIIANTPGLTGAREWQLSWTVVPVTDKLTLLNLQHRYQAEAHDPAFSNNYVEGSEPLGTPYGRYGSKYIWPKDNTSTTLTTLITDVLDLAPISASEHAIQLPGPQIK